MKSGVLPNFTSSHIQCRKRSGYEINLCDVAPLNVMVIPQRSQSRSQSPRSLWSAETTRLDLWDNPKPEAKLWLPVSRAHVRACSKVHKLSMRKGYIPGRKGAKITSLPLTPTRPCIQMTDANHPGAVRQISWELVSSRFACCPILFKPLGAKSK